MSHDVEDGIFEICHGSWSLYGNDFYQGTRIYRIVPENIYTRQKKEIKLEKMGYGRLVTFMSED